MYQFAPTYMQRQRQEKRQRIIDTAMTVVAFTGGVILFVGTVLIKVYSL